jgi:hypothetical protein
MHIKRIFFSKFFMKKMKFNQYQIKNIYTKNPNDLVLDDKYYDIKKSPTLLTDNLNLSSKSKPNKNPDLDQYIKIKNEKIFLTKEKEQNFLANNNLLFNLPRDTYINYINKGFNGSVEKLNYKEVDIYLISTNYNEIDIINLFKLLNFINPDMIQIQIKPDKIIKNLNHFYGKKDLIKNLIREAWEIQPSLEQKLNNFKKLLNENILISQNSKQEEIINRQKNFIEIEKEKENNIFDSIASDSISMISLWAEENKKEILISDSPENLIIEKISNSNSLVFIKELFKNCFIQFPNNPDFEPRTLLGIANNLYPDVFLNISDSFITCCIEQICELPLEQRPKKLVSFLGCGQSMSVPYYLKYNSGRNDIIKCFENNKKYNSVIFGEDNLEILVEKWVMILIILRNIVIKNKENLDDSDLVIENLIKKYAREDLISTGFNSEEFLINRMKHLFKEIFTEKKILGLKYLAEGHRLKKKEFMKRIATNPSLNSQLH